jgi:hypothetical protein
VKTQNSKKKQWWKCKNINAKSHLDENAKTQLQKINVDENVKTQM